MFQIWSICHLTSGICATNLDNSDPRYLGPIKMCFLCINFDRELSKQPLYQGLFNYSCFEASVKSTLKYFWHFTELSKAMGMCPQNATVQTVKVFPWTLVLDMSPGTVWWKVLHLYIFQLFVHYFISSDSLHLQFSPCCIACPHHNTHWSKIKIFSILPYWRSENILNFKGYVHKISCDQLKVLEKSWMGWGLGTSCSKERGSQNYQ